MSPEPREHWIGQSFGVIENCFEFQLVELRDRKGPTHNYYPNSFSTKSLHNTQMSLDLKLDAGTVVLAGSKWPCCCAAFRWVRGRKWQR